MEEAQGKLKKILDLAYPSAVEHIANVGKVRCFNLSKT